MFTLPLVYQPREPVENSLTPADSGIPLIFTVRGWALRRKWLRDLREVVRFAIVQISLWLEQPSSAPCFRAAIRKEIITEKPGEVKTEIFCCIVHINALP